MKDLKNCEVLVDSKNVYVKPAMSVYEMELDAAVLTDTTSEMHGEEETNAGKISNPFGEIFNTFKA